jgi:hypothetical protein
MCEREGCGVGQLGCICNSGGKDNQYHCRSYKFCTWIRDLIDAETWDGHVHRLRLCEMAAEQVLMMAVMVFPCSCVEYGDHKRVGPGQPTDV